MNKHLHKLAHQLKKDIGCHFRHIGAYKCHDEYLTLRTKSDLAESLAKYLIHTLADRQQAEQFAYQVGMPGALWSVGRQDLYKQAA